MIKIPSFFFCADPAFEIYFCVLLEGRAYPVSQMSRILDGIRARHWWTKATGTVTGDPTPSDSAAMQKRLQQRLLDCVLLRKYEEALLLLDALLSEKRFNIYDYWKVSFSFHEKDRNWLRVERNLTIDIGSGADCTADVSRACRRSHKRRIQFNTQGKNTELC